MYVGKCCSEYRPRKLSKFVALIDAALFVEHSSICWIVRIRKPEYTTVDKVILAYFQIMYVIVREGNIS